MALRSATPFHNQWPNTTSYAALPNVSAPDTAALQVGDICYDSTNDVYYYCTDATLGAAVWQSFSAGPSVGTDRQEPAIIVGNALTGDTLNVCDILDPGDGTGIQTALAAAAWGTIGNFAQDVYVRPGIYTIDANTPITLTVPDGVKLRGAGRGRTIIRGVREEQTIAMTTFGCEVQDLTIFIDDTTSGAAATGGFITVGPTLESNPLFPFAIRRVDILLGAAFDPTNSLIHGIDISPAAVYSTFGNVIEDVRVNFIGLEYTPRVGGSFPDRTVGVYGLLSGYTVNDPRLFVDVRNVTVTRLELGFETDGPDFILSDCFYDGSEFNGFSVPPTLQVGFRFRAPSRFSKADNCRAILSLPSGIQQGFGVARTTADANFQPCYIAFNNCSVYYQPAGGPLGIGFIAAGQTGAPIQSLRLYGCQAENCLLGYVLGGDTEYCVAIGNTAVACSTDVIDGGTGNDFGHLQSF